MLPFRIMPLLLLIPGVAGMATAQPLHRDNVTDCRFVVPEDLAKQGIRWLGPCRDGLADGLGVVRTGAGNDIRLFAGRMARGRPVAGYFDTHAVTAGPSLRFDGEKGLPVRNRAEAQRAYKIAADGAAAAAVFMHQEGNEASAAFYGDWSRTLSRYAGEPDE